MSNGRNLLKGASVGVYFKSKLKGDTNMSNKLFEPIARQGEPIYASIIRNRSGIDSGNIDFGCRTDAIEEMSDYDKQEIVDIAYALYESVCNAAGKRAKNEKK